MRLYGAYGSNLNIKQMQKRCPKAFPIGFIYIKNWELVFKGVADFEKKINGFGFMGIYEITKSCENNLDEYEEYPRVYKKNKIKKNIEGKVREIMFYTMSKKFKYAVPTIKYFKVIEKGFKDFKGDLKLLKNASIHSINNNTKSGYKSENWKDNKFINNNFLNNRTTLTF